MFRHHHQGHVHSHSLLKSTTQKNNNQMQGFQYPCDKEDALYNIWESYKKTKYVQAPIALKEERNKAIYLMMQCHKILKLPLQTLFLAASVFDKVLNTNYQLTEMKLKQNININILAIVCLYSCQKLQKIRNYGVSHWLKHLSVDNLSTIGYSNLNLTSECIKKYEAFIMQVMNYNLFSSTLFDELLAIWTLKPPNQKQFYFGQYLLQLSLFCQLGISKKQVYTVGTAQSSSFNQNTPEVHTKDVNCVLELDIAIAISNLSSYFFGKQKYNGELLLRKIWSQLYQNQNNIKQLQFRRSIIKFISNELFEKVRTCQSDQNCKRVLQKYKKQTNFAISTYKFIDKSQAYLTGKNLSHSTHLHSDLHKNTSIQERNKITVSKIESVGSFGSMGYVGSTNSINLGKQTSNYYHNNYQNSKFEQNMNAYPKPDSARDLSFRSL